MASSVGQIAVMQDHPAAFFMRDLIKMIDTVGIEHRCPTLDAMNLVSFID